MCGAPPRRGSSDIGYVPQQKGFDRDLPIRGIDLVRLGLDGHRWGIGLPSRAAPAAGRGGDRRQSAQRFRTLPIGSLSGGEQQRLRIAQALLGDPQLLLCDEPLLSLDLKHQREVVELIDAQRRASAISVLFVTHEINPILPFGRSRPVPGGHPVGGRHARRRSAPAQRLSELYQTDVEVLRGGRPHRRRRCARQPARRPGSSHHHHP